MCSPSWTDIVQAVCAIVSAVGVVGTLFFAAWQIHLASKQMRDSSAQAKRESEDRNRPYISLDVVPSVSNVQGTWDLLIVNSGGTAARQVKISLKDGALIGEDENSYLKEHLERLMADGFDLMPGMHKRICWIISENKVVTQGAPLYGTIVVNYRWVREEQTVFYEDYCPYDCMTPPILVPGKGRTRYGSKDADQMKNIEYALRSISTHLGELRR
ncbi:hypothetical protein BLEM_2014 [Bifidobacterium lemurum]|uniref:Uncharacterized protein n=1 Tax=Bifidobacterium lemurum TaxID=1603886 RepID=A0A261FMW4_9BIFI|nr:hypothetical protein [Bifidobacterium lemurum]OZG60325.1 hypothetical protein BLEM_2014 [Bifidobacterium lemurum]QOL34198.1 hypothetical protein BL8807_10835 [Bifidobacterium lemurum]